MFRLAFLPEGPSDGPLADIIERLFSRHEVVVDITEVPHDLLPTGTGRSVTARLQATANMTATPFAGYLIHRDADKIGPAQRRTEIASSVESASLSTPHVPVIPIRMTEAWLLLDEQAIRQVAGNPKGRVALDLPSRRQVESHPDPKSCLSTALVAASESTGRRRRSIEKRFGEHRRQLLERLDIDGPVTTLSGWKTLLDDVATMAATLGQER